MSKRKTTPTLNGRAAVRRTAETARSAGRYLLTDPSGQEVTLTEQRARASFGMQKSSLADARRSVRAQRIATSQAMAEREVRRRFLAREREHERGIRAYWAFLKAKVKVSLQRGASPKKKAAGLRSRPIGQYRLPTYSGPIVDAKGRRGVFMSVEYVGARRSRFGAARRMIVYITREDGVERDKDAVPLVMSNVGETADEQAMAFELVEVLNRSARANGKLFFTMIVNLPHDVDAETRRQIVGQFCEEAFGTFDLPYCAALHEPSEEGDQRNKHAHIVFALRPLRRIGDHEWEAGRELLTEHDNAERFSHHRELFARIMTEAVQAAGKRREYTHLSNAARSLKGQAHEKLGERDTRLVRQGKTVLKNERNKERVRQSEILMAQDRSSRRRERGKARQAAYAQVQAMKLPAAPPPMLAVGISPLSSKLPDLITLKQISIPTRLPSAPAAASPVQVSGALPVPSKSSQEVKLLARLPMAQPSSRPVLTCGILPNIVQQQPVLIPAAPPSTAEFAPAVFASSAPTCSSGDPSPVNSSAKLPSAPLPSAPVQLDPRSLELLDIFQKKEEELAAKRKRKAELIRQQALPDRGHSI